MSKSALLLGMLCALSAPVASAGEIYQWKDARGVTHYSDAPPPKGAFRARKLSTGVVAPAKAAAMASETPAAPRPASDQCTVARANPTRLRGSALVGLDANGDGVPDTTMTDAQRGEQITLAEKYLVDRCTQAADTAASPR
ncbi:MAG TPA: DUF4124 domain-containing protein [Xanthomonadaceae bacterium]|nr:DUF4124 domain-containing protein [Xanthomonadaceae bacterium]